MLSKEELQQIEDRLQHATPSPWISSYTDGKGYSIYSESAERAYFYHGEWIANVAIKEDAIFIANAVNDMIKLINEIYRLKNMLDKNIYKDIIESYCKMLSNKQNEQK